MRKHLPVIIRFARKRKPRRLQAKNKRLVCRDPDKILDRIPLLGKVVRELVRNCVEEGADEITVTVESGRITVEDDLRHSDPQALVDKLNHSKPRSDKPDSQRVTGKMRSGAGIVWSRDLLKRSFGEESDLVYEPVEDNRIKAIATWPVHR